MADLLVNLMNSFHGPFSIGPDRFIRQYFVESVQLPTKNLFRELFMQERMTAPTDINASSGHFGPIEILAKPLVAMTGPWGEVVEREGLSAATKSAPLAHFEVPHRILV